MPFPVDDPERVLGCDEMGEVLTDLVRSFVRRGCHDHPSSSAKSELGNDSYVSFREQTGLYVLCRNDDHSQYSRQR